MQEKAKRGKLRVLMCCSDPDAAKGGMVTVVENYLASPAWKKSELTYVATHIDGGQLKKTLFFARAYVKVLVKLLRREVDVAHLHMAERGSFYRKAYLTQLLKRFGVPVVVHHHAAEFEDFYARLSQKQRDYVRRILEMADCNLVLSKYILSLMQPKAPDARFEVLHNAVNVAPERRYAPEGTRLIMLGRQGKRKGSYDLLEAMAEIKDRLPADTQLWMCGDGEPEKVRARAEELGLGGMLAYAGWISGEERERCVKGAMVHILPSYNEGLPMSILETMARGIPNISTNIASIPEVVKPGVTGYMITPGDKKALGEAILDLVGNNEKREEMSKAAHALIAGEFSLENSVAKVEKIYQEITRGASV